MSSVQPLGRTGRVALTVLLVIGVALAMPDPVSVLNFVAYAGVGAFVAARRPRNPIGWILVFIAFGFIATSAMPDDIEAVQSGTSSIGDFFAAWVGTWAGGAGFLAYAALAMLFPTGRLSGGPRWRRVAPGLFALGIGVVVIGAFTSKIPFSPDAGVTNFMIDNRFALIPPIDFVSPVPGEAFFTLIPIGVFAVGVVSAALRYRRATGTERLQLRWLMAAIAFAFAAVVAGLVLWATIGLQSGLIWIPALIAYPTVPLAVGVAVMRYRLFEIDRILSRGLSWALLSGLLVAVYAGAVILLQSLLGGVTQGETVAVAGSTLLAAALFQPLRLRIQSMVDHRFNRARYDAERTAIEFAERLRDEVDLGELRDEITNVVDTALHPHRVSVWIRRPGPTAP
jgi:hypothetical protein